MRNLAVFIIMLFLIGGCAKKEVVQKEAQAPKAEKPAAVVEAPKPSVEEKKPEPAPAKAEPKKMEEEKITEKEMAMAGKKSEAKPEAVEATAEAKKEKLFVAEAKAACLPDSGEASVGSVYFDFDRYAVREDSKPALKELSEWMSKNDIKVHIEGYCDERGTAEYNLALGDRRASSAKDYLMHSGIPSGRLETISCGEEHPLCAEKTEECWAKNRRARFIVIKK